MPLILPGNVASALPTGYEVDNSCRFSGSDDRLVRDATGTSTESNKAVGSYGTATAKAHADSTYTNQDKTDGIIPDGKDVGDVKTEGLKTIKIKEVKKQAAGILQDTDWYITRKADAGTAVPSAITTHRAAVRTKCAEMETAITNAADTPALETLYTYTEQEDGSITRPLGELPRLET